MDIYLSKEKINHVKSVLNASIPSEETMEMIVPDALPDILRIVDADATVFLRSKSTDPGRVTVTGVAAATVIYCGENESGVFKLELEIPFSAASSEGEILPSTRVTASVTVTSADASMINPRKIIARVNLLTNVTCYNDAEIAVASGMDEDNDAEIELLTDSAEVDTTTGVREKTFVISDELTVPAANPPIGEILKYKVQLVPDDTKVVGNKLILRGTAYVSLLYRTAEENDLSRSEFSTEFSQILELDGAGADSGNLFNLMLTNAYFDAEQSPHNPDGRTVIMEVHAVAQCVLSEKKRLNFISDIYSTKYNLEQTTEECVFDGRKRLTANAVFHGMLETPTNVSRVVALNVHAGDVASAQEPGGVTLRCPLNVNAVYVSDDGRVMSTMRQYEAEAGIEGDENVLGTAAANCGKDAYGAPVGGGIELRIPVEFDVIQTNRMQMRTLAGLSYDETNPADTSKAPSLVVYRAGQGDSLWNLAKKNRSTAKLIAEANALENEDNVAGQLLIIPKKR